MLDTLLEKKNIFFTKRGNASILIAFKVLNELGYKRVGLQDQGGWFTYKQYAKKLGFEIEFIKSENGIIPANKYDFPLFINSMPAYAFVQDMKKLCKNNFVVNDATGTIGTKDAKYGDIVLGSFGKCKPVDLGKGGFITTDDEKIVSLIECFNEKIELPGLDKRLDELDHRIREMK